MFQKSRFLSSIEEFRGWLDLCEQWGRAHLLDTDPAWSAGVDADAPAQNTKAPAMAILA